MDRNVNRIVKPVSNMMQARFKLLSLTNRRFYSHVVLNVGDLVMNRMTEIEELTKDCVPNALVIPSTAF